MAAESIYKKRIGLLEITIENFKAIKDRITIPIRPITMLYGANSAGKSTIIHALAYLREIICNNNPDADQTEIGGESIRLGGFRNIVHNCDLNRIITIGVNFRLEDDGLTVNSVVDEDSECPEKTEEFLSMAESCGIEVKIWHSSVDNRPIVGSIELMVNGEAFVQGVKAGESDLPELVSLNYLSPIFKSIYGSEKIELIKHKLHIDHMEEIQKLEKEQEAKVEQFLERAGGKLFANLELNRSITSLASIDPKEKGLKDLYDKDETLTKADIPKLIYYSWKDSISDIADNLFEHAKLRGLFGHWHSERCDFRLDLIKAKEKFHRNMRLPITMPHKYEYIDKSKFSFFDRGIEKTWVVDSNDADYEEKLKQFNKTDENLWDIGNFEDLEDVIETVVIGYNTIIPFIKKEVDKFSYIGPIRIIPTSLNSTFRGDVSPSRSDWATGEAAWELLRQDFDTVKNETGDLINGVNGWMNQKDKLDMGYKLSIKLDRLIENNSDADHTLLQVAEDGCEFNFGDEYTSDNKSDDPDAEPYEKFLNWYNRLPTQKSLTLTQEGKTLSLSPKSVGVGIAQVIPILTAASHGELAMITVEQPELHLHPRVQCNLSDVFIESIKKGTKSYILESHSEHLLLRIQRRIKEKKLHPSDVSILFIEPSNPERGSDVQRLRLDEEGAFIDDWPDGFFEEGYEEVFAGL